MFHLYLGKHNDMLQGLVLDHCLSPVSQKQVHSASLNLMDTAYD